MLRESEIHTFLRNITQNIFACFVMVVIFSVSDGLDVLFISCVEKMLEERLFTYCIFTMGKRKVQYQGPQRSLSPVERLVMSSWSSSALGFLRGVTNLCWSHLPPVARWVLRGPMKAGNTYIASLGYVAQLGCDSFLTLSAFPEKLGSCLEEPNGNGKS